jgi:TPR repeat protein
MYDKGEGVAKDDAEAARWYRKAAEQGYAKAQFNLGFMYANGEGVAKNFVLAHMWWNLARAQGHEKASELVELLVKEMTKEQIAEAQRLATEWQEKHQKE